jgi:hypothetical protein
MEKITVQKDVVLEKISDYITVLTSRLLDLADKKAQLKAANEEAEQDLQNVTDEIPTFADTEYATINYLVPDHKGIRCEFFLDKDNIVVQQYKERQAILLAESRALSQCETEILTYEKAIEDAVGDKALLEASTYPAVEIDTHGRFITYFRPY